MVIDINQRKISIGDKYQIFIDGQQTHTAARKLFRIYAHIDLYDMNGSGIRMAIDKKFSWLKPKYDITRYDGKLLAFRTVSFWKRHYQCICGNDTYDIYGHRGRKFSVYKNDLQVAWWTKKAVTWFAGDNYKITADRDVDYELMMSFCLIVDNHASDENNKAVNIDLGHIIGPQARKFDANWQPKYG